MSSQVWSKKHKQWMDVKYIPLFDQEDRQIGTARAEIANWMDSVDIACAEAEAVTLWASDHGLSIDEIYW